MSSVARAQPHAYTKKLAGNSHPPRSTAFPPSAQYCDIPADFSKVDSILRHLQQTESHDWLGEITHCCTQVCYLLLQNYNISRFAFYNYNFHLIVLTALFFCQRIWHFLWRAPQFSDAHGLRFACHIVLFMVLLDALYCAMQLVLKESVVGGLYLATPLLSSVLFYHVYLKTHTNVFTIELFSMLGRCVYHSLETAYCIGVLPLKFLQYEHVYYETSRCVVMAGLVTAHVFLSLFCLELHCLGSEVLQQTRMLGEWRWIPDLSRLKTASQKPPEWSYHNCPYPRGAVVRCEGKYYEAVATLNTCMPTCSPRFLYPLVFVLGDSQRTKALVLAALLILNAALVHFVLWSNQWAMYAVMLVPNCGHFLYVKYRRPHAFFNPAHLNLRHLQWDLNQGPQGKLNGNMGSSHQSGSGPSGHNGRAATNGDPNSGGGWSGYGEDAAEDEYEHSHHPDDVPPDPAPGGGHLGDVLSDPRVAACLQCPNPLFMSAVSASTMFFFGPSGSVRSPSDAGNSGLLRHEGSVRSDM